MFAEDGLLDALPTRRLVSRVCYSVIFVFGNTVVPWNFFLTLSVITYIHCNCKTTTKWAFPRAQPLEVLDASA